MRNLPSLLLRYLFYLSGLMLFHGLCHGSEQESIKLLKKSSLQEEKGTFSRYYLMLGYNRNFPAAISASRFETGIPHPVLSYRYFLNEKWLAGVSAQFRFFSEKNKSSDLVYAVLSQESFYMTRIYHPLYALMGWKIHYLYPARKGMFPLNRHPSYTLEIGVGCALGFLYQIHKDRSIEAKIERWRGTKTNKIHGFEFSVAYGFQY